MHIPVRQCHHNAAALSGAERGREEDVCGFTPRGQRFGKSSRRSFDCGRHGDLRSVENHLAVPSPLRGLVFLPAFPGRRFAPSWANFFAPSGSGLYVVKQFHHAPLTGHIQGNSG